MIDHILDLSESPAYLRAEHEQLVIERKDLQPVRVPLAEIAVVIMAHPQITATHAALAGLVEKGGALILCDRQSLPVGLMLPTQAHFTQAERFAVQAAVKKPTQKRIWKQIVRLKILAQADLLREHRGNDHGLKEMAKTVRSGDPANVEAQAARRYWPAIFDDPEFRRRRDADDQNRMLNYGYAVLRAVVARAICAVGLHPSLGLHHHNRYDAFCLADDLMEPYRPIIDDAVLEYVATYGKNAALDRQAKQAILATTTAHYRCRNEARTLFDLVARTASSLVKVYLKETDRLFYPGTFRHA